MTKAPFAPVRDEALTILSRLGVPESAFAKGGLVMYDERQADISAVSVTEWLLSRLSRPKLRAGELDLSRARGQRLR